MSSRVLQVRSLFTFVAVLSASGCFGIGETDQHLSSIDKSVAKVSGQIDETFPKVTADADAIAEHLKSLTDSIAQMALSLVELQKLANDIGKIILEGTMVQDHPPADAPKLDDVLGSTSFISASTASALAPAEVLAPIRGSLCIQADAAKIFRVANQFAEWTRIPESTYRVMNFKMIKLASAQSKPWEAAVAQSSTLAELPADERAVQAGEDQFAFFFFQPGTLDASFAKIYPRFGARCSGQLDGASFRQDCRQLNAIQHFGVDSFESVIEGAPSATCGGGTLLNYDIRITLNEAEVKQIRDALLGGFSTLAGTLASPATFIRGYFENFYPGWKSYVEKL